MLKVAKAILKWHQAEKWIDPVFTSQSNVENQYAMWAANMTHCEDFQLEDSSKFYCLMTKYIDKIIKGINNHLTMEHLGP